MDAAQKRKLIIAVSMLVVTGLVLAWYYGLFAALSGPSGPTAEDLKANQEFEQQQQQIEQKYKANPQLPKPLPAGS